MSPETAVVFAKALCVLGMTANAVAEGKVVVAAFDAIARNPKLEETLFSKVIVALALVESTAIYSLVAFFTL